MTAALDLAPEVSYDASGLGALHAVIDTLDVDGLPPTTYADAVADYDRAIRRLEALRLRLVARADRARVARDSGMSDTGAWLSRQTRSGSTQARRDVRLAGALDDTARPASEAFASGEVSREHAAVIVRAIEQLPRGLSPAQVGEVEQSLVEKALVLDPQQLRRVARRALEAVARDTAAVDAHEDGLLRDEEDGALARTRLTLHDNDDGTTTGHFTVPTLAASVLTKVLDAMTAPRRGRLGAPSAQAGDPADARDPAHERGLAFVDLLERLPVDHLHGKVAATVIVTLDLDTLRGRLRAAGLDTGDLVSASAARRLACNAGLVPAVLGGPSQPLDLGRSSRLFTEAQRTALATHHTTCSVEGCQRPFAWCELHHRDPWSSGGSTDLADAVPLCGFHHRRIHDSGYVHRFGPGGVTFHRRT